MGYWFFERKTAHNRTVEGKLSHEWAAGGTHRYLHCLVFSGNNLSRVLLRSVTSNYLKSYALSLYRAHKADRSGPTEVM